MERAPGRLAVVVVAACLAACGAQPLADGDKLLAAARTVNTRDGPRAALPVFRDALRAYRASSNVRGEAITLGNIGVCYKNLGDYQEALRFHGQALQMKRALGDRNQEGRTLANIGQVYWKLADYPRALDHYHRALAIFEALKDPELQAAAINGMSLVYDELGEYRTSRDGYQKALALYAQADAIESPGASDALGNLGGTLLLLGHFDEAEAKYRESLQLSERLDDIQRTTLDLGNLALCAMGRGDFKTALDRFDRALALARRAGLPHEEADWLKGRGETLLHMGRHDEASKAIESALAAYQRAGLRRELAEALLEIGALHEELGDDAAASTAYNRAARVASEIQFARGVAGALIGRGDIEGSRARFRQAASAYFEAMTRARREDDLATLATAASRYAMVTLRLGDAETARRIADEADRAARASASHLLLAETRIAMGEVSLAQGDGRRAAELFTSAQTEASRGAATSWQWRAAYSLGRAEEQLGNSEAALTAYRRAVEILEQVRSRLSAQRARAGFLAGKHQVYQSLVRLLIRLGRTAEAFKYAERLRAYAFRDLLLQGPAAATAEVTSAQTILAARVRRMQRAIEEESARPLAQQRQGALTTYSTELADAEHLYQTALDRAIAAKGVGRDRFGPRRIAAADVSRQLGPGTALIEYLVLQDAVAAFVLTGSSQYAQLLPTTPADLTSRVEVLRDLLTRVGDDGWKRPAAGLYERLFEPIVSAGWLNGITRCYVVPHGVLHYVPFSVLADRDGRLVVDRFVTALLPAAATLLESREHVRDARRGVLVAAPDAAGLEFTREEAQTISRLSGPHGLVLLGSEATETAIKRAAARFARVHLATHGSLNRINPLLSSLEFAPDADNDGHLQVFEILALPLSARLTVLSACQTALAAGAASDEPPGDEFIGLTQAFLSAGSEAVLASLWSINDRATVDVMRGVYARPAGQGIAKTLADVQREWHGRGAAVAHPYYWAAFVVVGAVF